MRDDGIDRALARRGVRPGLWATGAGAATLAATLPLAGADAPAAALAGLAMSLGMAGACAGMLAGIAREEDREETGAGRRKGRDATFAVCCVGVVAATLMAFGFAWGLVS